MGQLADFNHETQKYDCNDRIYKFVLYTLNNPELMKEDDPTLAKET